MRTKGKRSTRAALGSVMNMKVHGLGDENESTGRRETRDWHLQTIKWSTLPLPEESDRDPSCSVSCIRGNDGKNERRSHYRKSKPVKSNSLKHLLLFKLTNFSPNAWNMVSIYIHFLTLTPKESKCSALMYHR